MIAVKGVLSLKTVNHWIVHLKLTHYFTPIIVKLEKKKRIMTF